MATDYKIEFKDVHGQSWRVWVRDKMVPPLPYDVMFWEELHNEGDNFYVNFWASSWPEGAVRADFIIASVPALVETIVTTPLPITSSPPRGLVQYSSYKFAVRFYNANNVQVGFIADIDNPRGLNNVVELKPAGRPLLFNTVNNGDDKFEPIRATECVISFINDGFVSAATFADNATPDDRWAVEIFWLPLNVSPSPENWKIYFKGFLQLDDISQPLQDPTNVVKLTATDKLGALKDVPLQNFTGSRYFGITSIITYIAMALAATGLALAIKTCGSAALEGEDDSVTYNANITNNLITIDGDHASWFQVLQTMKASINGQENYITVTSITYVSGHTEIAYTGTLPTGNNLQLVLAKVTTGNSFYEMGCVDSRTFDINSNEAESCYLILSKLLSPGKFVTQYNGAWWIMDVSKPLPGANEVRAYTHQGVYVTTETIDTAKIIARNNTLMLIDANATEQLVRPAKSGKLTYKYELPPESLENEKYTYGQYISAEAEFPYGYIIAPIELREKYLFSTLTRYRYNLDGWSLFKIDTTTGQLSASDAITYIRRYYFEGQEIAREIAIEGPATSPGKYLLENNAAVPVEKGDKVLFSFEINWTQTLGIASMPIAQVLLYGDSGKVYSLQGGAKTDTTNQWYEYADGTNPQKWWNSYMSPKFPIGHWINCKNDLFGLDNTGGEYSNPMPENGYLKIRLLHFINLFSSVNGVRAQSLFRNLQLDIKRYINTNVLQAKGQYNQISQPGKYFKKHDVELFIDNSPKRSFNGALLVRKGNANTGYGFDHAGRVVNDNVTYKSYGALLARILWQQVNRVMRIVNCSVRVNPSTNMPGLLHAYSLEPHPNKLWHLLGYQYNVEMAQMSNCTLVEIAPVQAIDSEVVESGFVQE